MQTFHNLANIAARTLRNVKNRLISACNKSVFVPEGLAIVLSLLALCSTCREPVVDLDQLVLRDRKELRESRDLTDSLEMMELADLQYVFPQLLCPVVHACT